MPTTVAPTTTAAPPDAAQLRAMQLGTEPWADVDKATAMVVRSADGVAYASSQTGEVWRLADPAAPVLALDLTGEVSAYANGSERGLLGLAFSPVDDRMFVFFTDGQQQGHLVSYAMATDGTADPASAWTVIDVASAGYGHKGGPMSFDGSTLYVALGDGAASNGRSAQDMTSILGSIIRIVPHTDGPGYDVPPDNPFVADQSAAPELWAKGLSEPWGFWRDPVTGNLWTGDVGESTMEELNRIAPDHAGANFGWYFLEGTLVKHEGAPADVVAPLFAYRHDEYGPAIMAGRVYRGSAIAPLDGAYVFGDMSGPVFAVGAGDEVTKLNLRITGILTGWAIGSDGELYALTHSAGIKKVVRPV
ncbi:MAG: PQQ-dependent sugar dehydrogenase [Ilumatobacteraceae bacterium]